MISVKSTIIICFIGAAACFYNAIWFRRFKVPETPPKSRAHLSREERQRRMRVASWVLMFTGILMLALALFLLGFH
jgi:hypothetical protein